MEVINKLTDLMRNLQPGPVKVYEAKPIILYN